MKKSFFLFSFLFFFSLLVQAQNDVSGVVTDSQGFPLPGASVIESGTTNGVATDIDGKYSLSVGSGALLTISYVGYKTIEVAVDNRSIIDVSLREGTLEEVVVVGSRTAPRSSTDTPLPIDIVSSQDLISTGQATFDKTLQYRIPSFNTVQTPVNDATALLDPYEIRNMGPSRTLILINGKRKNLSSLLYTQTSPGRGETGADVSAIPIDAIKRVEVLRDGASAQYGSDAIAGVMNIILKDDPRRSSATLRTGITTEGDGFMIGASVNGGHVLGKEGAGFINYTVDFSKVQQANRPGKVSSAGEQQDFGHVDPASATTSDERQEIETSNRLVAEQVDEFLSRKPDAGNINASPETTSAKFLVNGGIDLNADMNLYFNAAYVYKKVNSFANYRTPYWRTAADFPYLSDFFPAPGTPNNYDGYVPTFDGDLGDYNGTLGFKAKRNGWNYDVSLTVGGNRQTYYVTNTHNRNVVLSPATWIDANGNNQVDNGEMTQSSELYRRNSPISFDPGGTQFTHIVGNIDISKVVHEKVSIGFGSEFRSEIFEIIPGSLQSYDGGGADSFAGNRPENSGIFNRYNIGGYFDISYDILDNLLINGTARVENYSDFGLAFVYKFSSRYKVWKDRITIRASYSTGFRAPTLHQIYTQKAQYSFSPGQGIQVGGLINNVSPQAKLIGVPNLKAEQSQNITVGVGVRPIKHLSVTIDYYNIAVKDRIVLGTEISRTDAGNTPLDAVLQANNLVDISFFSNAINTRTQGIDVVVGYKNLKLGPGYFSANLSGNYTIQNAREGAVRNTALVTEANQSVVDATQEALFFTSRPETKWILVLGYEMGKFNFSLANTLFGKTTFKQQGLDNNLRTEFIPKLVTDLSVSYRPVEKVLISFNANNIFHVLPEWKFVAENAAGQAIIDDTSTNSVGLTPLQVESNLITFNQRYSRMTYDGYHFSQLGAMLNLSVNYQF